uniref:Myb-like domain-containing protein n=1 Tax=Brassica oleracea var. oleracea TaxID=109376 RepID=A0A0D3C9U8_BRAOL
MYSYPSSQTSKFVEVLNSQQSISFGNYEDSVSLSSSQAPYLGTLRTEDGGETGTECRERRKWTHEDDILLISSWLNTSKDPVVSNDQRSGVFWTRITAYFAASQKVSGCKQREASHCKQRWHKINDLVCKFCGAYETATRERSSGQNENDVLKLAHEIFYNNHKKKILLEHAWKELKNDQKWCELSSAKNEGSSKKRKCEDGADSSNSQATETMRPPGVKATKARAIINLFGDGYLRRPTPDDLQCLLHIRELRGFPGMIGSIDCTLNDINVLDRSHVFDDTINGQAPQVNFSVNGREYHLAYYLTDDIYPKWVTFIQSIPIPQGPKAVLFAQRQEVVRKDVERAFGVLQDRFAIVKNPSHFWDKIKIENIMRA